jgi:hypothetical protein
LPNYFVSNHPLTSPLVAALNIPPVYEAWGHSGVSFWLEII